MRKLGAPKRFRAVGSAPDGDAEPNYLPDFFLWFLPSRAPIATETTFLQSSTYVAQHRWLWFAADVHACLQQSSKSSKRRSPRRASLSAASLSSNRVTPGSRRSDYIGSMRLHLVDGTYELFRAHYSRRPEHRAPSGQNAKATLGVVSSLLALLHDEKEAVTHLAVAFDNPIRSFRNDLFAGYKSEEGVEPELLEQFDSVEDAVRAIGITVWSMRQYEADDALATAARRLVSEVDQVRILSPDKDLMQCLCGERVVQVDRQRQRTIDEASFRASRGFAPASIPDFLALTGDSADGIPGLPGFGDKSAALLLGAYGQLERIPEKAEHWSVPVRRASHLAAVLVEQRAQALLYRKLATLVDVPLSESLDELRFRGVPRSRFEAWCDTVGTSSLRNAPKHWE